MSNVSKIIVAGAAGRRIDPVLIVAGMLFAALFAAALLIGVRAAPSVDLLAPAYVT